jgi:nifR3 family TIM-barrel protein
MQKINNFWYKLKETGKPILALAPMAGFTNSSFRILCKDQGADVLYSEMASVAALYYAGTKNSQESSAAITKDLLKFDESLERPYVVQLFGSNPEHFALATRIVTQEIKPDGIDINFGCPVSKVIKQGAGASLMQDLSRSRAVVEAVLDNTDLPVSIKIRAASGEVGALDFLENISDLNVSALMIHGRTLKQGFVGDVDYNLVRKARKYFKGIILTNGGINTLKNAQQALIDSGADGLGLARGILGRPWLFSEIKNNKELQLSNQEIFDLMIRQAEVLVKTKEESALIELRKHLVWYAQGLKNAKFLREGLVAIESVEGIKKVISDYKKL